MNADLLHAIWTALLLIVFVGIVLWAWSKKRKRGFEEAARLPLDDSDTPTYSRDHHHG